MTEPETCGRWFVHRPGDEYPCELAKGHDGPHGVKPWRSLAERRARPEIPDGMLFSHGPIDSSALEIEFGSHDAQTIEILSDKGE